MQDRNLNITYKPFLQTITGEEMTEEDLCLAYASFDTEVKNSLSQYSIEKEDRSLKKSIVMTKGKMVNKNYR